jgi:hypothetical protein
VGLGQILPQVVDQPPTRPRGLPAPFSKVVVLLRFKAPAQIVPGGVSELGLDAGRIRGEVGVIGIESRLDGQSGQSRMHGTVKGPEQAGSAV